MSNVVHAFGNQPLSDLQEEMIRTVEQFSDDIRSGRIVAIGMFGLTNAGSATAAWHKQAGSHFGLVGSAYSILNDLMGNTE